MRSKTNACDGGSKGCFNLFAFTTIRKFLTAKLVVEQLQFALLIKFEENLIDKSNRILNTSSVSTSPMHSKPHFHVSSIFLVKSFQ